MPTGVSSGNHYDFGHFDQCFGAGFPISTQHCQLPIASAAPATTTSFVMGVCTPQNCTEASQIQIFTRFMANAQLNVVTDQSLQCVARDKPNLDVQQWIVIALLIALGCLVVGSTLYEVVNTYRENKTSEILSAFSVFRNLDALLRIRHDPMPLECLNGIRVLSMLWILLYYSFTEYKRILAVFNPNYFQEVCVNCEPTSRANILMCTFSVSDNSWTHLCHSW